MSDFKILTLGRNKVNMIVPYRNYAMFRSYDMDMRLAAIFHKLSKRAEENLHKGAYSTLARSLSKHKGNQADAMEFLQKILDLDDEIDEMRGSNNYLPRTNRRLTGLFEFSYESCMTCAQCNCDGNRTRESLTYLPLALLRLTSRAPLVTIQEMLDEFFEPEILLDKYTIRPCFDSECSGDLKKIIKDEN